MFMESTFDFLFWLNIQSWECVYFLKMSFIRKAKKWELLFSEENKSLGCQIDAYFWKDGSTFGVREE